MKKKIAFLSALLITAMSVTVPAVSAEGYAKGDVDMDGAITGRDVAIIAQYADGVLQMELNDEQLELADVNDDGNITVDDAELIYEVSTRKNGDVDGNGSIEVDDMRATVDVIFLNKIREIEPDFDFKFASNGVYVSEFEKFADFDFDGDVDFDDLAYAGEAWAHNHFGEKVFYDITCDYKDDDEKVICGVMSWMENNEYCLKKRVDKHFDKNGDEKLSIDDASAVLAQYADRMAGKGIYKASDEEDPYDVNGDGVVDIADTSLLLKIYAYNAASLL